MSATLSHVEQANLQPNASNTSLSKSPLPVPPVGEARAKQTGSEAVKKKTDEALKHLVEALQDGKSAELRRYLSTVARFRTYSFSNQLLIYTQMPEATQVAGYKAWQKLGRQVRKGQRSIRIIAPMIRKARKDEKPDTADGKKLFGFRLAAVFDVSQTEGENLPEVRRATGEPGQFLAKLEQFAYSRQIKIEYVNECVNPRALGVSRIGLIQVRRGQSAAETFATLAHEIAHELMHTEKHRIELSKTVKETEAEAVAYVVGQGIGLDQAGASADYLQLYDGNVNTLTASLERIQSTACEILAAIVEESKQDDKQ